jgi:rubrerythrin
MASKKPYFVSELTVYQFLYIFELTAPVFYRVKRGYLKNKPDKDTFLHFEKVEKPHSPMIKEFLKQYNKGVFPWPKLIETGAAVFSHFISLFGEKAMYAFEYHFETKAVNTYTNLANSTVDEKLRQISIRLREEEVPHLEFFMKRLGKTEPLPQLDKI